METEEICPPWKADSAITLTVVGITSIVSFAPGQAISVVNSLSQNKPSTSENVGFPASTMTDVRLGQSAKGAVPNSTNEAGNDTDVKLLEFLNVPSFRAVTTYVTS